MATTPQPGQALGAELETRMGRVDRSGAGAHVHARARRHARVHALALFHACGGSPESLAFAVLDYAAGLLSSIAVDLAANPRDSARLFTRIEAIAGVSRVALGREVLRTERLLELPVDVAIETQLALLLAFARVASVSLWTRWPDGEVKHVSHAGEFEPEPDLAREAARTVLDVDRPAAAGEQRVAALRIERLSPPPFAVIAEPIDPTSGYEALLLSAAAPMLAALLDREALLAREQSTQETVMSAVQRRLATLRFDLHDGPQQDVHLLAQDLGLFREQLRPMIAEDPDAHRLLGRLDDVEAQLVALDGDLRRLSTSVQSPFMQPGSLPEALEELTDSFAARTGVRPSTKLSQTLGTLTDSQQITLLSLIREALSNIRQHSDARTVTIAIESGVDGVHAEVTDDGAGFDPETVLVRAARAGRLGLVGMHERVRMLGGRTQIDSRPGGPTVISATLPPAPVPAEGPGKTARTSPD